MSDLTNVFTDIADAIRAKTETQITYKPTEMADAINNIETGGGALVYNANGVPFYQWFNAPITIAEGVTITSNMFTSCFNFNQPVTIPNGVTITTNMFRSCSNLNQPVTIPNGVTDTANMFAGCSNFNQPVTIPNSVTNTALMFISCDKLNQPVIISNNVTNTANMFFNCRNFNQFVSIPSAVGRASSMFFNCRKFNQPIIVPNVATNVSRMLFNCENFRSNIYAQAQGLTQQAVASMLQYCDRRFQKHIFTQDTSVFNGNATTNSITGFEVTWTQDGDNYYNTFYNIYIHNVAEPFVILNNESYHFDSQTSIPDSPAIVFGSGVRNLRSAFSSVSLNSSNTLILFEEGVEDLSRCFVTQSKFNQPLTIPSSAVDCREILSGCSNFNSPVVFRNGVENIIFALTSCSNFKADLWIPESVTNMSFLLGDVPYTSGTVHISHNIALGDTNNNIYNSLVNGYIGITLDPSRILNDY